MEGNSAVCLLVGCLTSQQQAGVSQGRICSDNFTCCHTEIEVADQTNSAELRADTGVETKLAFKTGQNNWTL